MARFRKRAVEQAQHLLGPADGIRAGRCQRIGDIQDRQGHRPFSISSSRRAAAASSSQRRPVMPQGIVS